MSKPLHTHNRFLGTGFSLGERRRVYMSPPPAELPSDDWDLAFFSELSHAMTEQGYNPDNADIPHPADYKKHHNLAMLKSSKRAELTTPDMPTKLNKASVAPALESLNQNIEYKIEEEIENFVRIYTIIAGQITDGKKLQHHPKDILSFAFGEIWTHVIASLRLIDTFTLAAGKADRLVQKIRELEQAAQLIIGEFDDYLLTLDDNLDSLPMNQKISDELRAAVEADFERDLNRVSLLKKPMLMLNKDKIIADKIGVQLELRHKLNLVSSDPPAKYFSITLPGRIREEVVTHLAGIEIILERAISK
jgi:hypothetical protein